MKWLINIQVLLAFGIVATAQTVVPEHCPNGECNIQLQCPAITVTGPAGISMPGETIYFRAAIDANPVAHTQLRWTVSGGTILSGQDSSMLAVRMPSLPPVTATILVDGLPKDCPNSASDRYDFAVDPGPILVDEFGRLSNNAIEKRLEKLVDELSNNRHDQGFIINYGTEKEMEKRERLIAAAVSFRHFGRSRITIVRAGRHESGAAYTKLYRIPPGAENPAP